MACFASSLFGALASCANAGNECKSKATSPENRRPRFMRNRFSGAPPPPRRSKSGTGPHPRRASGPISSFNRCVVVLAVFFTIQVLEGADRPLPPHAEGQRVHLVVELSAGEIVGKLSVRVRAVK